MPVREVDPLAAIPDALSSVPRIEQIIAELDRAYAEKQMAKINWLADNASRGSKGSLAAINKIANMTIWTLPRSMHGPFIKFMKLAQGAMRG